MSSSLRGCKFTEKLLNIKTFSLKLWIREGKKGIQRVKKKQKMRLFKKKEQKYFYIPLEMSIFAARKIINYY